jgi:hypothetical protein
MRHEKHEIQRAADALHFDAIRDIEARRARLSVDELGEIANDIQVEISGIATTTPVWADIDITFDVDLLDAPEQRDSPLSTPHVHHGFHMHFTDADGEPVAVGVHLHAFIVKWVKDDRGVWTSAKLRVGMSVLPGDEVDEVHVHGFLHLTIHGYGAPVEDYDGNT